MSKRRSKRRIEALVEQQVEEKVKSMPVRRTPGEMIAHDQGAQTLGEENRYKSVVKDIARDGYHKIGTQRAKAIDIALASMMLRKAHSLMPDRVSAPSDDLIEAAKALTSTGSATGDELVPTGMAAQLWQDIFWRVALRPPWRPSPCPRIRSTCPRPG